MSRATPLKTPKRVIRVDPADWQSVLEQLGITDKVSKSTDLKSAQAFMSATVRGLRLISEPVPSRLQRAASGRKVRAARESDRQFLADVSPYDRGLLLTYGYPAELLSPELHKRAIEACKRLQRDMSEPNEGRQESISRGWRVGIRRLSHACHDHYRSPEAARRSTVSECVRTLALKSGAIGEDEDQRETFEEQFPRYLLEEEGFGHGPAAHRRAIERIARRVKRGKLVDYDGEEIPDAEIPDAARHPAWWESITEASPSTTAASKAIIEEHERKQQEAAPNTESDPISAEILPPL